jgi:hypothetical protein
MTTTEEHVREAERLAATAEEWMDADDGWKGALSTQERLWRRSADLQAAQVHATLAQTLKAGELLPIMAGIADWIASGVPEAAAPVSPAEETCPGGC